jgi:GMP synthase (glutamine-hydrolysing)
VDARKGIVHCNAALPFGHDSHDEVAMRSILILQHEPMGGPGLIGDYLREAKLDPDVRSIGDGDRLPGPGEVGDHAALIVLGGDMNVDQEADYPFLEPERAVLADALRLGVPTLGICLGAQQLALAAGGDVYRRAAPLLGWGPIQFLARDGFVADVHPQPHVFSWRAYTCRLPDGATMLADTDGEPQIFRVGDVAWGLMFHPEIDKDQVLGWIDADKEYVELVHPGGVKRLRSVTKRELLRSAMLCGELTANFLAAGGVRERHAG